MACLESDFNRYKQKKKENLEFPTIEDKPEMLISFPIK